MADSNVNVQGQPNAQGAPNLIDVTSITVPANTGSTVLRQRMVLADPNNAAGFAPIDSIFGVGVYARQEQEMIDVLRAMLSELQQITQLLGGVSPTS